MLSNLLLVAAIVAFTVGAVLALLSPLWLWALVRRWRDRRRRCRELAGEAAALRREVTDLRRRHDHTRSMLAQERARRVQSTWTTAELVGELAAYRRHLDRNGLTGLAAHSVVGRIEEYLRWLDRQGDTSSPR